MTSHVKRLKDAIKSLPKLEPVIVLSKPERSWFNSSTFGLVVKTKDDVDDFADSGFPIRKEFIRGTIGDGVNVEETYAMFIEAALTTCVQYLPYRPRTKALKKAKEDLNKIHRILWKLVNNDSISEIILRTSHAIENDSSNFNELTFLKAIEFLKIEVSKEVKNLF